MTSGNRLGALIVTLEQMQQVIPQDKAVWDSEPILRLAVERLWITAGNLAEAHRIAQGIGAGTEPWAELSP